MTDGKAEVGEITKGQIRQGPWEAGALPFLQVRWGSVGNLEVRRDLF